MKTELQKRLSQIAPSISIETHWEHDADLSDIRLDCDGCENENPKDWQAWQSEVRATAIDDGEEKHGSAYLGGTWEKASDNPWQSNPTISGYEPQMTVEALEELSREVPDNMELLSEIAQATAALKQMMREEYDKQMTAKA